MPLFVINIHRHESGDAATREFTKQVITVLNSISRKVETMKAEVQTLVDEVRNLKTINEASQAGWATMVQQTGDLKAQVAALQGQIAAGGIDEESIQAIVTATHDLHDVATSMQAAVPANTPAAQPAPDASQA